MILSRFWYVALSAALAGALFLLYLAMEVSNDQAASNTGKLLTAASNAVGWYLKDDARTRASALIPVALDPAIIDGLSKASTADSLKEIKADVRDKAEKALKSFREAQGKSQGAPVFDAMWAVDIHGRVLANDNFEKNTNSPGFEMGGYSLVADAIHGWIRDDAWVFNGQIWRVVARPVEVVVGGEPVGAIVGGKVVDDRYAQDISDRTGAAIAFFADRERVASGAPASFDKGALEVTGKQIEEIEADEDYKSVGASAARVLRDDGIHASFARMPGEAWDLGAGYIVAHRQKVVRDPLEFQRYADDKVKKKVPLILLVLIAGGGALLGLLLSLLEHTLPLGRFRRAVADLADKKSDTDVLKPSTFGGGYKKIAVLVNDALDKVASKAGVDRGPADLESVLGPLPAQPQMSAFAVPQSGPAPARPQVPVEEPRERSLPKAAPIQSGPNRSGPRPGLEATVASAGVDDEVATTEMARPKVPAAASPAPSPPLKQKEVAAPPRPAKAAEAPTDEETEWRGVYAEFVALKKQLGEPTERLTYEKFRGTLQRNKDALKARHDCDRVKFRVYEKQGRAALKASPVK